LRYHWLTRFYDPLVRLSTRERTFKQTLLHQAAPRPGDRVLDLGCGTATLTVALARAHSAATVTGIDADARALAIARSKAREAALNIDFRQASSTRLPLPDESFDRVVSSLFFHHLTSAEKSATLAEARRVLKPGGELHIADWGRPSSPLMRALFLGVQLLDGFETTRDAVAGALPGLLRAAGYEGIEETAKFDTPLGTMRVLRAARPH
jgi:ubiquinone/menaquinone biosynthesis C-methylase UbiE